MQFQSIISALILTFGAVNSVPTPQLDALTGAVSSLTSDVSGVVGGLTGGDASGVVGDLTSGVSSVVGDLTSGDVSGVVGDLTSTVGDVVGDLTGLLTGNGNGTSPIAGGTTASSSPGNVTNIADCPENTQAYCCDPSYDASSSLLGLDCLIQSVMGAGSTCDKESVCCTNNGGVSQFLIFGQ